MMLLLALPTPDVAASPTATVAVAPGAAIAATVTAAAPDGVARDAVPPDSTAPADTPRNTVNEFLPEERGLGECISAVPKPGCGSKARGGWRQGLVFLAIVSGLGVIAWRVVASSRRARRERDGVSSSRTPGATSARAERGGDH